MIRRIEQREGVHCRAAPGRVSAMLTMLLALLCLSACASSHFPSASVSQVNAGLTEGYQIAGGDKLKITVFDEPTLTGDYEVSLDGDLSLPLIGPVNAAGMTSDTLSEAISTTLREGGYVLSPRVAVEILEHRPFFILGEVKAPGEYPYVGKLTLEQAVAKAGGFSARADKRTIILLRQGWSSPKRIKLGGTPLMIAPGDTVTVQEAFF